MSEERFVIVATEGTGIYGETKFYYEKHEREAIERIMDLSTRSGLEEDAKVERVFKFDVFGNVTHYSMKLKGFKPALEAMPQEARTR